MSTESVALIYPDGATSGNGEPTSISGWGTVVKIGGRVFEGHGGLPMGSTNNQAELVAFTESLKFIATHGIVKFHAFPDSQYVINGWKSWMHGWAKRNWEDVKNVEYWKALAELRKTISGNFTWVKGHNGHTENERADTLALNSKELAKANDFTVYWEEISATETVSEDGDNDTQGVPAAKAAKAPKVAEPNALLCGAYLLTQCGGSFKYNGLTHYTCSFESDKDIKTRFLGVASPYRFEGVVILKERIPMLDALHAEQTARVDSYYAVPTVFNWGSIKSAKTWKLLHEGYEDGLKLVNNDLWYKDDIHLTHFLSTPAMAFDCIDSMEAKEVLLKAVMDNSPHVIKVDVTGSFVEMDSKGKPVCKPELTSIRKMFIQVDVLGNMVNVPLVFKQNGPDRNSIAKLLKQTKNVKVSIIIHDISKGGCRWSVMVESDDAVACYNNPSTNIIPFL